MPNCILLTLVKGNPKLTRADGNQEFQRNQSWIEFGQSKQNDYSLLFFESKTYKNESQEDSAWTNILKAAESKFLSFFSEN